MSRNDTTMMLSSLVEKRLNNRVAYWASEVSFDKGTQNWRRIDYVGFKPYTPNYAVEPVSVELGRVPRARCCTRSSKRTDSAPVGR